ncbi:MAG: hypothetical protein IT380_03885 [Myxococcales bacterium]|nr:hypothetical protein [Myxococcales bacterium]
MNELSRVATWKVVDDLVTRVYRASGEVTDLATRELLREAVLSLGPLLPLPVLKRRLEVVSALLLAAAATGALSDSSARTLSDAVAAGAHSLRRLEPASSAAAP